jgi:hypothetical protein
MGPYAGADYITSPYVHSRADSQHIYKGPPYARVNNPMPAFILQSRDFGFGLCWWKIAQNNFHISDNWVVYRNVLNVLKIYALQIIK